MNKREIIIMFIDGGSKDAWYHTLPGAYWFKFWR